MTEKRRSREKPRQKSDVTGEFSVEAVIEQMRRTGSSRFPPKGTVEDLADHTEGARPQLDKDSNPEDEKK